MMHPSNVPSIACPLTPYAGTRTPVIVASESSSDDGDSGTATVERSRRATRPAEPRPRCDVLPRWRVLLHNDNVNEITFVVDTVIDIARIERQDAILRVIEAHNDGLALLTTTHREHAELLQQQFMTKKLIVSIEPGD